ncbi:TRAP transporter large permease subunit [Sagittula sp. NFXS13]|uniref:TRAP transporter large permease subunit n=1 Tax=Sagittula sp. NFXS13 TaxID=2819095 RepID=UPI0032DF5F12
MVYTSFIRLLVTRRLQFSNLPGVLLTAAKTQTLVAAMIAIAATVTFLFTVDMHAFQLAALLQDGARRPFVFLCLLAECHGMFMEFKGADIMQVPLFVSITASHGIDPLHFGGPVRSEFRVCVALLVVTAVSALHQRAWQACEPDQNQHRHDFAVA